VTPSIFSVTSGQLDAWMVAFLYPFVRMITLVSTAPIFGETWVPRPVKISIAALLALVLAPGLPVMPAVPVVSPGGFWIIVQQVLIGAAMGFSMRLVFTAVMAAGEYIGLQMGLSFASFFDPMSQGATMVVSRLLNMLALLIFLAVDGHLMLVTVLAESFHTLPIADAPLAAKGWMLLVASASDVFAHGLMLSLPLVTALLILNLAMGILNRASPQFSIFAVGFPLTLLAGILMMQLLMPNLGAFLEPRFAEGFASMLNVTRGLRP
jgi:flagellar biosynthesis protein FliR